MKHETGHGGTASGELNGRDLSISGNERGPRLEKVVDEKIGRDIGEDIGEGVD